MIAVDLGQSGARIRAGDKTILSNRGHLAGEAISDSLRAIFSTIGNFQSDIAALSLTGLNGIVTNTELYQKLCAEFFGVKRTAVIDDGLAGFIGAMQGKSGVALSIGGGVVAVAGKGSNFSHTDGLGSTFGDEGGGFWLGSRAITRALATREGRDTHHGLLEALRDEVNAFDALEVKNAANGASLAITAAAKVLSAADNSIPIALTIRNEGARLLAQSIIAAWKLVDGELNQAPSIVIMGGLSKNEGYVKEIFNNVQQEIPNARLDSAIGDHLDGALWIASHMVDDAPPMLRWSS